MSQQTCKVHAIALVDGKCPKCGGSSELARPNTLTILGSVVDRYRAKRQTGTKWPYLLPHDPLEAAKWFMDLMEPMRDGEAANIKYTRKGNQRYWDTPYLDRLAYLFGKYVSLSEADQAIIVGCCEEEVYWRGEDIEHYYRSEHSVYHETLKMREMGVRPYIQEARRKALGVFKQLESQKP